MNSRPYKVSLKIHTKIPSCSYLVAIATVHAQCVCLYPELQENGTFVVTPLRKHEKPFHCINSQIKPSSFS